MHDPNFIVLWEAPKLAKPEFRLYYDESGRVLFYSGEKPEGNYIVIDTQTFAEGRPDLRVVDGRISTVQHGQVVSRLAPGSTGTLCAKEDISIVVDSDYGEVTNWELKLYEL